MNNVKDSVLIFLAVLGAIIGLVVIAVITNGIGADGETQKALGYVVVAGMGALGGSARQPTQTNLQGERGYGLVEIAVFLLILVVALILLFNYLPNR